MQVARIRGGHKYKTREEGCHEQLDGVAATDEDRDPVLSRRHRDPVSSRRDIDKDKEQDVLREDNNERHGKP